MERLDRANQIYHLELIKSKSQQENADARSAAVCLIVIPVASTRRPFRHFPRACPLAALHPTPRPHLDPAPVSDIT